MKAAKSKPLSSPNARAREKASAKAVADLEEWLLPDYKNEDCGIAECAFPKHAGAMHLGLPGLLGELELTDAKALLFLSRFLVDKAELLILVARVTYCNQTRKDILEALLLAESVIAQRQPEYLNYNPDVESSRIQFAFSAVKATRASLEEALSEHGRKQYADLARVAEAKAKAEPTPGLVT